VTAAIAAAVTGVYRKMRADDKAGLLPEVTVDLLVGDLRDRRR
jgi:hypothetical protein